MRKLKCEFKILLKIYLLLSFLRYIPLIFRKYFFYRCFYELSVKVIKKKLKANKFNDQNFQYFFLFCKLDYKNKSKYIQELSVKFEENLFKTVRGILH